MKKRVRKLTVILTLLFITSMTSVDYTMANEEEVASWTEVSFIEKAKENDNEIKKYQMDLELLLMSEKDINDLKKMDVDDVAKFQALDPNQSKSKTEIRTEATISKLVTPLQYDLNKNSLNRQMDYRKLQIQQEAKTALYEYFKANEELNKIDLAITRAQETYKNVENQYKQGLLNQLDVNIAKYQLDLLASQRSMVLTNLDTGKMNLNKWIGQELDKEIQIEAVNQEQDTQTLKTNFSLDKFTEFYETALENRPDYLSLKENAEIAQKIHEIYQENYTFITDAALQTKKEKEFAAAKALLDVDNMEKTIYIQVKQQLSLLNVAFDQVVLQEKAVENAAESYRISKLLYENGMARYDEVLGAELQWVEEENKLIEAKYNVKTSLAQLELMVGSALSK